MSQLLHLEHGRHHPLGLLGALVAEQPRQHPGHDLPRHAVPVLEPAALPRLLVAALAEPGPVVVDLVLCLALDLERDGLVEREDRVPRSAR